MNAVAVLAKLATGNKELLTDLSIEEVLASTTED